MKLGCSLVEAFGETWETGHKFGRAPLESFQIRDPYGPYGDPGAFETPGWESSGDPWEPQYIHLDRDVKKLKNEIRQIQAQVSDRLPEKPEKPVKPVEKFTTQADSTAPVLFQVLCSYFNTGAVENILLFVMIFMFVNNLLELLNSSV